MYSPVPPDAVTEVEPLLPPLQATSVWEVVAVIAAGCVIVKLLVMEHKLASEMVTV